jgi:hypothetical protein
MAIMRSKTFEDLLARIRGEYTEMPGLRLTADQGSRLWGLDLDQCEELLHVLVERGFLTMRADGKYGRLTEGAPDVRHHMMKASLDVPAKAEPALRRPSRG